MSGVITVRSIARILMLASASLTVEYLVIIQRPPHFAAPPLTPPPIEFHSIAGKFLHPSPEPTRQAPVTRVTVPVDTKGGRVGDRR